MAGLERSSLRPNVETPAPDGALALVLGSLEDFEAGKGQIAFRIAIVAQGAKAFTRLARIRVEGQCQGLDDQRRQIGLVALEMVGHNFAVKIDKALGIGGTSIDLLATGQQ